MLSFVLPSQAHAATNRDGRSACDEGRGGRRIEKRGESSAVETLDVAIERGALGSPDRPLRVLHLILHGAAVSLTRVPPVVLCDEGLERIVGGQEGLGGEIDAEP